MAYSLFALCTGISSAYIYVYIYYIIYIRILFNIYIDGIIREAMDEFVGGVQLSNTKVQVLLFADDIVMVTERKEDIQRNLGSVEGSYA